MNSKKIDLPLMGLSLVLIIIVVILLAVFPEGGTNVIYSLFTLITKNLGAPILWFGFAVFIYCC